MGGAVFSISSVNHSPRDQLVYEDIAVGDIDNDAITDVVLAGQADKKFFILYGNSSGTFARQDAYVFPSGITRCRQGAVVDVNNDGAMDIAFACDKLVVLRNDGHNGFNAVTTYATGDRGGLAVLDANMDGYADIAVTLYSTGTVYLFVNDGAGGFSRNNLISAPQALNNSIYTTDVNKDGYVDLMASSFGNAIVLYLGNGTTTFSSPRLYPAPQTYTAAPVDLNNDGLMDVVAPSDDVGLTIYMNRGCAP